jgi:redox-sensing transcriptional repressor
MKIPGPVSKRLALYHRCVATLLSEGKCLTSSQELGERLVLKPSQIRKDLSYFGEFGKRGTGYNLENLRLSLENVLRINKAWNVCIVGAGNIGTALANHKEFFKEGYNIIAFFDRNPLKIGKKIGERGIIVYPIGEMEEKIKSLDIEIGVIAVPASEAKKCGRPFGEIWNKGHTQLCPDKTKIGRS